MPRFPSIPAIIIAPLLLVACGGTNPPTASGAPAMESSLSIGNHQAATGRSDISLNIMDACDPATFNAVVGPGTCLRPGGTTFSQFVSELTRHQEAGAWHFAAPTFQASAGQTIVALNRGGETHTFTHVAAFGGGIVPFLNDLSGNPVVAPECTRLEADDFTPPDATYTQSPVQPGTQKFQCCIHPWMHVTVDVR